MHARWTNREDNRKHTTWLLLLLCVEDEFLVSGAEGWPGPPLLVARETAFYLISWEKGRMKRRVLSSCLQMLLGASTLHQFFLSLCGFSFLVSAKLLSLIPLLSVLSFRRLSLGFFFSPSLSLAFFLFFPSLSFCTMENRLRNVART